LYGKKYTNFYCFNGHKKELFIVTPYAPYQPLASYTCDVGTVAFVAGSIGYWTAGSFATESGCQPHDFGIVGMYTFRFLISLLFLSSEYFLGGCM